MTNRISIALSASALLVALFGSTALGGARVTPAWAAAGSCASLARVSSYHGHARLTFSTTASGFDPDNREQEKIEISRQALNLRVDLTRKATEGDSGPPKYAGHESYNGPMLATFGAAQLYVDTRHCAYKLHVTFLVRTNYSGSRQIQPRADVSGFSWTAPEPVPGALHLVGGDGPDAYTGGCPGNPLLSTDACYDFEGGWAKHGETLAGKRGPFEGAQIIWVLMPAA